MLLQQEIAFRHNRKRVGELAEVLIDSPEEEHDDPAGDAPFKAAISRRYGESPEIDPVVFITPPGFPDWTRRVSSASKRLSVAMIAWKLGQARAAFPLPP